MVRLIWNDWPRSIWYVKYWTCSFVKLWPDLMIWCRSARHKSIKTRSKTTAASWNADLPLAEYGFKNVNVCSHLEYLYLSPPWICSWDVLWVMGCKNITEVTYISLKSRDTASTSINPVIFSWLAKCRRSVTSRRALFASWTFSKTRVTILIATVSPEISSEAELSTDHWERSTGRCSSEFAYITTPYAPVPISLTSFHLFSTWNILSNACSAW